MIRVEANTSKTPYGKEVNISINEEETAYEEYTGALTALVNKILGFSKENGLNMTMSDVMNLVMTLNNKMEYYEKENENE